MHSYEGSRAMCRETGRRKSGKVGKVDGLKESSRELSPNLRLSAANLCAHRANSCSWWLPGIPSFITIIITRRPRARVGCRGATGYELQGTPPSESPFRFCARRAATTLQIRHAFFANLQAEREIFIDNLLVRVHLIIKMSLVGRPCATGV